MNHNGYHPQGMQGYSTGQAGYASPQYTTPQVSFNQNTEQSYSQNNTPYGSPTAYPQQGTFGAPVPQNGYGTYPQQGGTGSFIPQTPYSPGYTSPDYQPSQGAYMPQNGYPQPSVYQRQPMNGYPGPFQPLQNGAHTQQGVYPYQGIYSQAGGYPPQSGHAQQGGPVPGYNPYGQMGRMPQQGQMPNQSIPLNGGGYVPQRVPVRKRGFEFRDWYLIAAGVFLIALFITATLILKSVPLKIVLILLAAGSAGILWVKPLAAENKRLTYSILALALCILTAISFLMKPNTDVTNNPGEQSQSSEGNLSENTGNGDGMPEIPMSAQSGQNTADETPEPESAADGELMERLVTFFNSWNGNRLDEMLELCMPSWKDKLESPRTSLFSLLANRTPVECFPETLTGTAADTTRKVIMRVKIDHNNGKPQELYRMTIMMVKEANEWYVDPQSLLTNENLETPDPNITPTPAPTETPAVYATTTLYYNTNGGEYYHLDPNCKIINPKYLPLGGTFTYGQILDDPYSKLKPCNVCGAPLPPD